MDFLKNHGEISIPQFKDLTQASRKFTIPLLEYFDSNRVTVRVGEARRLREGASAPSRGQHQGLMHLALARPFQPFPAAD